MAGKFLSLEEAAEQLGVSPEKLKDLRDQGVVHGYRDGASWKFKPEVVEQAAEELKAGGGSEPTFDDDELISVHDVDGDLGDDESDSSILVSEQSLGHSEESTSSTIIGRSLDEAASADSDLSLAPVDSGLTLPGEGGSNVSTPKKDSDVTLVPGSGTDSDVSLVAGESDLKLADDDDELTLKSDSVIDVSPTASDLHLADGSEVLGGSDLQLDSPSGGGTGELSTEVGSSGDLALGSDVLALDDDELSLGEDDDLVLGGSGVGSDVSLSAADSGINLTSPSDSGLSLEDDEPLDLGGSSISSLELPEDDEDIIALDSEMADADATTQLKQDEEFLLSPSDELAGDESDSGSQVIALEDSEAFDEDAATMVHGGAAMAGGAMETVPQDLGGGFAPVQGGHVQQQIVPVPIEIPEAPYSIWNVLGLMVIVMTLSVTGMLMTDVVRNIWSWESGSPTTSSLMDWILSALKF